MDGREVTPVVCPGCGGLFAAAEGPTHPYMIASAGCWAAFGEVLAREYAEPALFAASHRLTVDAYALQHPGSSGDRKAHQSVWVHFASLHAIFATGLSHTAATEQLKAVVGRAFPVLPPAPAWRITVADVTAADHEAAVERWARHAHDQWAPLLRAGLDAFG